MIKRSVLFLMVGSFLIVGCSNKEIEYSNAHRMEYKQVQLSDNPYEAQHQIKMDEMERRHKHEYEMKKLEIEREKARSQAINPSLLDRLF